MWKNIKNKLKELFSSSVGKDRESSGVSFSSKMHKVESFTTPGVHYNVDLENMSCDCIDWVTRRSGYSINDPLRVCKHLSFCTGLPKHSAPNRYSKPRAAKMEEQSPHHGNRKMYMLDKGAWYTKNSRFKELNVETRQGSYTYCLTHNSWKGGNVPKNELKIIREIFSLPEDLPTGAVQTVEQKFLNTSEIEVCGKVEGEKIVAIINYNKSSLWHQIKFNRKQMFCYTKTESLHTSQNYSLQSSRVHNFLHLEKAITNWVIAEKVKAREIVYPAEHAPKKPAMERKPILSEEDLKTRQRERKRAMRSKPVTPEALDSFKELKSVIDPMLKEGSKLVPLDRKKYYVAGFNSGGWLCHWHYKTKNKYIEIYGQEKIVVDSFNGVEKRFKKEFLRALEGKGLNESSDIF
ncbi:hypothetical protein [Maridesulfovibrio ferrireducens]|uniref:hypothetical protein n=1 Tax=Maridesulfovibrio ferrireducens TaxID=246191 RepID=UPI001A2CCD21|nr:hypothetical protein [Maridesulfovibrio ferrireducens]MBI9112266.1 hypothetical protein [Maridesulfovibrio ferrireducens]